TGTVTVRADGGATGFSGSMATSHVGGEQAGGFKIRGPFGQTATFTLNPKTVILTDGGGATMKVDNFRLGGSSKTSGTYTIPLDGTFQTGNTLGGRLSVGPAKPAGTYSGSITITATGT